MSAENFKLPEKFDRIFAIHLMHWIKDQPKTLKNIFIHLKPQGKIYFILAPDNKGSPWERALQKTLKSWRAEFLDFKNPQYLYDIESYRKLVIGSGFHIQNMSYTHYQKDYADKVQFGDWVKQSQPHYQYLPLEKKEKFLDNLIENYRVISGQKSNKKVVWSEYILTIEATRPEDSLS